MKVVELTGPGMGAIRVAAREARAPGPGEVLLKLKAASLNYRDLLVAKGFLPLQYPRIPLSDAVGEVVELGAGVSRVARGDRVCPTYYPDWISGPIAPEKFARDRGAGGDGVAAEYLALPERELVRVPAHLGDAEAAALPCAGVAAWTAVTQHAPLKPGSAVLIQGTGGVSLFALQFALAAGAETYLISSSDEKLERARQLGAHHLLNYRGMPQWSQEVLRLSGGRGVDLVVDIAGPGTLGQSIAALTSGGHISQVGVLGDFEAPIPLYPVMTKAVHIDGVISGNREAAEAMMRAIGLHKIRPVVDREFGLDELPEALAALEGQGHFGKIGIRIAA
jgi:NADPH:quinone reductase-like Zn-dependent oxidoreductase